MRKFFGNIFFSEFQRSVFYSNRSLNYRGGLKYQVTTLSLLINSLPDFLCVLFPWGPINSQSTEYGRVYRITYPGLIKDPGAGCSKVVIS